MKTELEQVLPEDIEKRRRICPALWYRNASGGR